MKQSFYFRSLILAGLLILACVINSVSQIATSWTADMPSSKIPTGVTLTNADTLEDFYTQRFTLDLDATTYDNANKVTAFNAIGAAAKTAMDTGWVEDKWGLDTSLDILGVYVIESINRVFDAFEYGDHIAQYGVAEDVYRVKGRFKYIILPE